MTNLQSLSYYWPELILTVFILAALITDLCLEKSRSDIIGWVLAVGLIVTSVAIWNQDGTKTTLFTDCLLYTSPSPRDGLLSRMPSSA